jgi:hypothetical protein
MHIRLFISDSFFGALKEQPEYDLDGNMTNDGRFSFTWDSAREMMPPPQDDSRNHNNYRGLLQSKKLLSHGLKKTASSSVLKQWFPTIE